MGFFCGQRTFWTKVLRVGLLGGFSALIFRNQNPAYTIKKGRGNSHLLAGISNSESEWTHLLAELHSCTGFNAAACPLRCVACCRCFWCQSLSLSCNVADNYWPLDEMLPAARWAAKVCVLRVPGGTGYWGGGWQVHYGVDRWLVVKLPRCHTNQLTDAKKKQARARLRYTPCRAAAANAWWHNLMRCHMVGPYALNAQTRRPQTRANTIGALSVWLHLPRSVGLYAAHDGRQCDILL